MARSYDIETFDDLLKEFAGHRGLQRKFGLSQPAISHWRSRGIPTGYHLRLYLELRLAGRTINPDLFEIDGELASVMNDHLPAVACAK